MQDACAIPQSNACWCSTSGWGVTRSSPTPSCQFRPNSSRAVSPPARCAGTTMWLSTRTSNRSDIAEQLPDDEKRPPVPHLIEESSAHRKRLTNDREKDYPFLMISNHLRWPNRFLDMKPMLPERHARSSDVLIHSATPDSSTRFLEPTRQPPYGTGRNRASTAHELGDKQNSR